MNTNVDKKICLTIQEAVEYSGLGRNTIEAILDEPANENLLLKVGNRRYVKRQLLEQYLNDASVKELKTK